MCQLQGNRRPSHQSKYAARPAQRIFAGRQCPVRWSCLSGHDQATSKADRKVSARRARHEGSLHRHIEPSTTSRRHAASVSKLAGRTVDLSECSIAGVQAHSVALHAGQPIPLPQCRWNLGYRLAQRIDRERQLSGDATTSAITATPSCRQKRPKAPSRTA